MQASEEICQGCHGAGGDFISIDPVSIGVTCPDCKGTGKINRSIADVELQPLKESEKDFVRQVFSNAILESQAENSFNSFGY